MLEAASPHDRRFYAAMALLLVVLAGAGFAPTFYARSWFTDTVPLPLAVQVHGAVGTAWVSLFAVQSALMSLRRVQWHRRVGVVGAVLSVAFVLSGAIVIANLEQGHVGESRAVLAVHLFTNVAPLAAFALFAGAAIGQRSVPARHKRFMLLAAVVLMPPAIGRLLGHLDLSELNLLAYAFVAFANAVYDTLTRGRPHAVSLLGATALVALDIVTTTWLAAVGS